MIPVFKSKAILDFHNVYRFLFKLHTSLYQASNILIAELKINQTDLAATNSLRMRRL